MLNREYNTRLFLFTRWMAVQYSSSVLNTQEGPWWKEQINYFNDKVFPEYVKNGTFHNTLHFMDPNYPKPVKHYQTLKSKEDGSL